MDLVPCSELGRQKLVDLCQINEFGIVDKQMVNYVAKTFPDILLDVARLLTEQATAAARNLDNPNAIIKEQLRPYLVFNLLLGKSPQITSLMYSYFEESSFQPLPADFFETYNINGVGKVKYVHPGFSDALVKEILLSYVKYLSFNPKWFASIWNWSELGRFVALHLDEDIRYLAGCCLSIITQPTRHQHMSLMSEIIGIDNYQALIDLQIKHRNIYFNTFKPCIETKKEKAEQYAASMGISDSGYAFCRESIAKVANVLLPKRDISLEVAKNPDTKAIYQAALRRYVPVPSLYDTISKIAYSISIDRPCLIRGTCGSGKTAILDYIAAHTNRINPPDYVKVQIGDQIDSKLLIGTYVCTEIPGQFEWQPGPLTKAMAYGSWIVFEDIDMAPSDMAQVIHSVIENRNLSCVSCCPIKLDSPHPEFRIFFTQRTRQNESNGFKLGFGFVEKLCDVVDIPELTDKELINIVEDIYKFGALTQTMIKMYRASEESTRLLSEVKMTRMVTLRDLFKLCARIANFGLKPVDGKYNSNDIESLYLNAIDCYLSSLTSFDIRQAAEELGLILNIPANEVRRLLVTRHPEIREDGRSFLVGRAVLEGSRGNLFSPTNSRSSLAYTKPSSQLLESISLCIKYNEPVLLIGETGVGKTSVVQHLADVMKTRLVVMNLSQQSDSSDLLGGYRPVELRQLMEPIHDRFNGLFERTFDAESNKVFLKHVANSFATSKSNLQWMTYLKLVSRLCSMALDKPLKQQLLDGWRDLLNRARRISKRIALEKESPMALSFSDGTLLRAVKEGNWILLDEINLAEPEALQCLLSILDSLDKRSVHLHNHSGGDSSIRIHKNFRIFACMNPSTDVGKRDLALGTRARFTEFFVNDIVEKSDLRMIVDSYVKACLKPTQIESVINFYLELRSRTSLLSDVSGNSPIYSLRTLCRALTICANNVCHNMEKSLYECLKVTFLQQLNESSTVQVLKLMEQTIFDKKSIASISEIAIPQPADDHRYILVEGFWIQTSNMDPERDDYYIVTSSVRKNLSSLTRIISLGQRKLPILIEGNTSVGKTSLIMYLSKLTGNKCYRINNHEHTDLQDYVGRYILREDGSLCFQDGLLVRAMKKGYWIILDELNLAPSELLEALNRVLDDNRELFLPDTGETIRAHSKFMLFATQNPPQEYAGRKLLSRAFRNRFIELHFDELPCEELEEILHKRCEMAPQHASKIVNVMREIQMFRRESGCFNGKNGFMTLRDLFRWGDRYATFKKTVDDNELFDWDARIAEEGLILLEGRVRTMNEADIVKNIIEKVFKRKLDRKEIYTKGDISLPKTFGHIRFSFEFKRLYVQLSRALKYREPVLLCGQTGCGKTTACQLYAALRSQELITYNCHQNSESSDFVGSVRPARQNHEGTTKQTFPWIDGPLVESMKKGAIFLMDEISLADDAVLERINSVLEPRRSITLTEKAGEEIIASDAFRLVATMNPGGDYGKKELSPALRNRFTEVYCHNTNDLSQIRKIIVACLSKALSSAKMGPTILDTIGGFLQEYYSSQSIISIRDVVSLCNFLNKTTEVSQPRPLSIQEALMNGVALVFLDQFGTCGHKSFMMDGSHNLKNLLRDHLKILIERYLGTEPRYAETLPVCLELNQDMVRFKKFFIKKGPLTIYESTLKEFITEAPTVRMNLMKIVRALQLDRPILLEGSPGAGKTSVVAALAKLTGHDLVRINLSEQTDISDLFGSDLPDSSVDNSDDDSPRFRWHDGPMLTAIKKSQWILLDEMNLASQSILEGLNACFDHRGEIYIPELNKRFKVDRSTTRIFACQNPHSQGASRKGLPQSFLNRFTSIYIESHSPTDLILITRSLYPQLPESLVEKMIEFNSTISKMPQYSVFEFNLRDVIHWCDLLTRFVRGEEFCKLNLYRPDKFVQFVYLDRLRSNAQRQEVSDIFEKIFACPVYEPPYRDIRLGEYSLILARSILPRIMRVPPHLSNMCILKYQMPYMESLAKAIELKKMAILIGESGVGKRSMVKILAGLTGNHLNIIGANHEMDTVELLGSFEQKGFQREIVELVERSKKQVTAMINSIPRKHSASVWTQLFSNIWSTLYATCIRDLSLSQADMMDAFRVQLMQMKDLIKKIQPLTSDQCEQKCSELIREIERLSKKPFYNSESMCSLGNFEWIDSILVKSIREGSWLMIENANLMNPATLDRLNSLVEPNGTLSLNEKGSGPEGIEVISPHPNFRLILTMSPDHGELSRAMRNRGVEIYVQTRFYFEDFLMLLDQNGFEPEKEKACMTYCIMQTSYDAHKEITGEEPEEDGSLLTYFALNFTSILTHQVRRGIIIENILADLLIAYYTRRGFGHKCDDIILRQFIADKMNQYRKTYLVDLEDERYKWRDLRYDLVALTGGDAIPSMLEKDRRIFFEDVNLELLFKPDELIENIDIVNTCINVKIFLELSTHGDFEYRKGFVKEAFHALPFMMEVVNNHVELLHSEYIPLINSLLPRSDLSPISEMHVDTRNSPDIHYYLQSLDYEGTMKREGLQNRWLLSLHRIMLRMIIDLIEERSKGPDMTSLWILSEKVRTETMNQEDLIRPEAKVATDLFDLLTGMLRVVSNRCFGDETVKKMIPKLFWINYFICKLKRHYSKKELIAVCNQIPMLWALTYQKVIKPMIDECEMADLNYKNKRFSIRIRSICEFLDMTLSKPNQEEKLYYNKVLNTYAFTQKLADMISREVNKFFATLVGRYTTRSQSWPLDAPNIDTLAVSSFVWSSSEYMKSLYDIEDKILLIYKNLDHESTQDEQHILETNKAYEEAQNSLAGIQQEFSAYESKMKQEQHRSRYLHINRSRNALDQYSPIWQLKFIKTRLSKLLPDNIDDPLVNKEMLCKIVRLMNGIIVSPEYYGALIKYFTRLHDRNNPDKPPNELKIIRENADMYSIFVVENLIENIVLDNQVVGWTKMRVHTSDLPTSAPLIPEYSPIISLVGSYCLDISHLKLSSNYDLSHQTEAVLAYLWRNYTTIKLSLDKDVHDLDMAKNLIHLRCKVDDLKDEPSKFHNCEGLNCTCVDSFVTSRKPMYQKFKDEMRNKLPVEDFDIFLKSVMMMYFGQINYVEYAPTFTLDPSLRSREKLEVYKSELAHIKLDLHFRNTLFYWKTGENLQLNEIDSEDASIYPFSTKILVERRVKLEKSINRLRREFTNRPKSDDGSRYYELRRDVSIHITRYNANIQSVVSHLADYLNCEPSQRGGKLTNLVSRCRMMIKSLEKTVTRFKSEYSIYSDLTSNFLVGMCFVHQGLRLLYARLEQKMQISLYGFDSSTQKFCQDIGQLFSFNNFTQGSIESVHRKLRFFKQLDKLCPQERLSHIQSVLMRTVLIQLNHHIVITPSDIKKCIPIVRQISDLFNAAWMKRKLYFEEQRKLHEELYQYKVSRTTLGTEITYERQEFLDVCAKFPTYDHIYQEYHMPPTSSDKENLKTEERICNMKRSVDLTMCIDICKAHYKFIKEASRNLLGQLSHEEYSAQSTPNIDLKLLARLEAETLYAVTRHSIPTLDRSFDSISIECHMMQAKQLIDQLSQTESGKLDTGSLKSSIEILDESIFDIYHDSNIYEALRFQKFIGKLDDRITALRQMTDKSYDTHSSLSDITKLSSRISSFLITEPLMKFMTGAHTLLEKIEQWNQLGISRSDKLISESDELIELIKSWRKIEISSWQSSLHKVKREYIDSTFCDLWFELYQAFHDPINSVQNFIRSKYNDDTFKLTSETQEIFYQGFSLLVKEFLESSTQGDYQIRLDLVFSFAIQTRFASLYEQAQPDFNKQDESKLVRLHGFKVNFEKLTTYVYNTHRLYQGLLGQTKDVLEAKEKILNEELKTEIRIVAWQGRNLYEIKNNSRISHRKLNKVMNKYLEVLRSPVPKLCPDTKQLVTLLEQLSNQKPSLDTERLKNDLNVTWLSIKEVNPSILVSSNEVSALNKTKKITIKLKEIHAKIHQPISDKYISNLKSIEQTLDSTVDAIKNFLSHNVQSVVISVKDSKETKEGKEKLCRQMYHSKKYSMQSIFKGLQQLGVSYQRGLIHQNLVDYHILSLEPLRGMVQIQSRSVMRAVRHLVDDNNISQCNEEYRKLLAKYMQFSTIQSFPEDLSSDQVSRMKGFATDLMLDTLKHNKNAALIFSHLINIQAATTRLTELQGKVSTTSSNQTLIYNYAKVHRVVQRFDELVGRAYLAMIKLEELAACYSIVEQEQSAAAAEEDTERSITHKLTNETPENLAILTHDQYQHIKSCMGTVRNDISEVSQELRNKLNYTMRNHLYSDDDIEQLYSLYEKFHASFTGLLREGSTKINFKTGTILGSMKLLLEEAEQKLKPSLDEASSTKVNKINLESHPNISKLNLRLKKLIRHIMLVAQGLIKKEVTNVNKQDIMSQIAKRQMKPFNTIDSTSIKNLLRLPIIAKLIGDCFVTLNKNDKSTSNIDPIIMGLTPILSIYTKNVSCFLNIILAALNVKLSAANCLVFYFTELMTNGFGLPYKVDDSNQGNEAKAATGSDGDNAGFGEGQGDKDASKKLEFESQLDDLKKNDDDHHTGSDSDETKDIEAHDDGVEMSEDIDSKAKGPGDGEADDNADEEENENNQGEDELDKEMDSVDRDENKLDEKLWDEKDDGVLNEKDNEDDLRETELEPSMTIDKDETELLPKDDQLDDPSKTNLKAESKSADNKGDDEREEDEGKPNEERPDDITQAPNEVEGDEPELDLEQEAQQATNENELRQQEDPNLRNDELLNSEVDMSLSVDGEDNIEIDAEQDEQLAERREKEEGEVSLDEGSESEDDGKAGETTLSQHDNSIDDLEIDQQLQVALEHPYDDEKLNNPIEETIRNLTANSGKMNDGQTGAASKPLEGQKVGAHTVYDVYSENEEDPLDFDEMDNEQAAENNAANEAPAPPTSSDEHQKDTDATSNPAAGNKGGVNQAEDADKDRDEEAANSNKRTLAECEDQDMSKIKRQKILSAQDSETSSIPEDKDQKIQANAQVRHTCSDKPAPVVIDLVSSEDEALADDLRPGDELHQQQQSKPRLRETRVEELTQIEEETSQLTNDESMAVEHSNTDGQQEQQQDTSKEDKAASDTLSSISSIESGELVMDSDNVHNDAMNTTAASVRDLNTSYNTNLGLLKYISLQQPTECVQDKLMERIDQEVSKRQEPEHESVDICRLTNLWLDCTRQVGHLVHELCQQLQIVLQPTKMSKYKGDYKTGKRLNMRKIISYIASHYRKDKIWLRRTKPSKRTYNIMLAVDNSSSMNENNCRQMTFQSLALLAKSLSLIEAGSLSVASFGEQARCIHEFGQPYMDVVGAQWLRELRFNETRTSYSKMLSFARQSFARQALNSLGGTGHEQNQQVSQLLVLISDGRNVTSEEDEIKRELRLLKSMGVLTLLIIIDDFNRNNGCSLVDVKRPVGFGQRLTMVNYMELFPFPFYVLLRQLETMPSILGDALRQWFELVSADGNGGGS